MGYDEAGRKSRSTNNKRITKYKASKGADFDDDSVRSIKTKTKYDKEGEIKKIKRVKKTKGGGKKTTISKPGVENNPLAPKGSTGLVTTKDRENWKFKSQKANGSTASRNRMKKLTDKINKEQSPINLKPFIKQSKKKKKTMQYASQASANFISNIPALMITTEKKSKKIK